MARASYDSDIERLRMLEDLLLQRADYFDSSEKEHLAASIDQLKEILYSLDVVTTIDAPVLRRLRDDLPTLISHLTQVVDGTNSDALDSVVTRVQRFYEYFARASKTANQNLIDEINALREQVKQYELQAKTRDFASRKLGRVRSAEATKEWSAYYEKHVTTSGISSVYVKSNWAWRRSNWAWWRRLFYWGENFYLLERKWAQWRGVWLSLIVVLSFLLGVWVSVQLSLHISLPVVLGEKVAFLPAYLVLSVGFAFASRNYRINANLLADYRHKQIVAKILENVIANNAFEEKDGMKLEMLQQGAKALFVPKNVGHLSKEAVEEFPVIELIKAIKKV